MNQKKAKLIVQSTAQNTAQNKKDTKVSTKKENKEETISVFMPMRLKKRGGRKMVLVPEGKLLCEMQENTNIDHTLLKSLVRAHLWKRQLNTKKYLTVQDLADANKVTAIYIQRILRLNYLPPKLKEAILAGSQPRHLKLADIIQNMPMLWHEQSEMLGMEWVTVK